MCFALPAIGFTGAFGQFFITLFLLFFLFCQLFFPFLERIIGFGHVYFFPPMKMMLLLVLVNTHTCVSRAVPFHTYIIRIRIQGGDSRMLKKLFQAGCSKGLNARCTSLRGLLRRKHGFNNPAEMTPDSCHSVYQGSYLLDLDCYFITRVERADTGGSAGQDNIILVERHNLRNKIDDLLDTENHVGCI